MAERTIKVIQPTIAQINQQKKTRAAAYCRVSTDSEDQANSFSTQLNYYADYIKSNPDMEFVDIYADEGITGTCVNKRDEFKRMMKDASMGKIDRIFVKSISRFARNSLECLEAIRTLSSLGVSVLFENDNIDTKSMNSELILYVKSAFAQSEALAGSKRVSTAIRMKMKNGDFITCSAPYGYKLDKEYHLTIIPEEAKTVKYIYDLYLSGYGMGKIVSILNDSEDYNRSGTWKVSAVRYILTNEKYIGDSLLQKTYTPQMLPLKNIKNHGELDKYYVTNSHEAIISRETYDLVQERLKQKRNTQKNNTQNKEPQKYLFTCMIKCGECGWSYYRKVQNDIVYWICARKKNVGFSCGGRDIREDELMSAFVRVYNKLRRFEREIIDSAFYDLLDLREKFSGQNKEIEQIDSEISRLCELNNNYTQLHIKGIVDDVSFLERTSELKYKTTELRNKRLKILNVNDDEKIIENIKVLKETLKDYPAVILDFDKSLFLSIVEKVIVENDETLRFCLKGGLILNYRRQNLQ